MGVISVESGGLIGRGSNPFIRALSISEVVSIKKHGRIRNFSSRGTRVYFVCLLASGQTSYTKRGDSAFTYTH